MSRIVTRTNEERDKELIEETARQTAENIKKTFDESVLRTGESKVTQILRNASKGSTTQQTDEKKEEKTKSASEQDIEKLEDIKRKERQELEKENEKLAKELEESEVYCPTCSSKEHKHEDGHEHKHKLKKTDKGTLKCTGENCNTEYILLPTDPDYKCIGCGMPKKKPSGDVDEKDTCLFCNGNEFLKYDWNKILDKKNKK